MRITDMKIRLSDPDDPYRAVLTMELDQELVMEGITLSINGEGDYILQFPYLTMADGEIREICYPVSEELKSDIYLKAVNLYILKAAPVKEK